MKRALVYTLPEKGHYLPLLGPAAALRGRGFEVVIAAPADVARELEAFGWPGAIAPPGAPPPDDGLRGAALARVLRDPAALRAWIEKLLIELPREGIGGARALMREVRPDVVAIDTMAYDAAIAAELEGVPWVGWATSLNPVAPEAMTSTLIETLRALDPARQALFRGHGLSARFRVSDVLSPRGTAAFTTEALAGDAPPGVRLVGPSVHARGGVPENGRSYDVYVSFGSQAWHQPERYAKLFEAARALPEASFLFAMGDLAAEARGLPENVQVTAFAPQLEVLSRARVLVTHGGANSVMEALAMGVPMLIAPLCNDQPHNLWFVERAGAGRGVDLEAAAPAEIARALREAIDGESLRAGARRIAASYASRSGGEGAARLAEEHAR